MVVKYTHVHTLKVQAHSVTSRTYLLDSNSNVYNIQVAVKALNFLIGPPTKNKESPSPGSGYRLGGTWPTGGNWYKSNMLMPPNIISPGILVVVTASLQHTTGYVTSTYNAILRIKSFTCFTEAVGLWYHSSCALLLAGAVKVVRDTNTHMHRHNKYCNPHL